MLTLHARTNVPLSSAQLPTSYPHTQNESKLEYTEICELNSKLMFNNHCITFLSIWYGPVSTFEKENTIIYTQYKGTTVC